MKILTSLMFAALMMILGNVNAQTPEAGKAATHFYIVNVDNALLNISGPGTAKNNDDEDDDIAIQNEVVTHIIDSIYTISSELFKSQLGLELLPLNELKSKIRYSSEFPNCPNTTNIKRVLKKVSGYKYYADYYVNIFSGYNNEYLAKPHLTQIKPLYALSFTLYDNSGKVVKRIDFSYRSKKPMFNSNKNVNISSEKVKTELCNLYTDALKEFTIEYKKVLLAKL